MWHYITKGCYNDIAISRATVGLHFELPKVLCPGHWRAHPRRRIRSRALNISATPCTTKSPCLCRFDASTCSVFLRQIRALSSSLQDNTCGESATRDIRGTYQSRTASCAQRLAISASIIGRPGLDGVADHHQSKPVLAPCPTTITHVRTPLVRPSRTKAQEMASARQVDPNDDDRSAKLRRRRLPQPCPLRLRSQDKDSTMAVKVGRARA